MTNTEMLRDKIKSSGVTITHIARTIGISREILYKKIANETEFKASEICAMARILHLTNDERDLIFLSPSA